MAKIFIALNLMLAPTLSGVATYYSEAKHNGNPLYCDQFSNKKLTYNRNNENWIAMDVGQYLSGNVQCGDKFVLLFEDGKMLEAVALDAGRFENYYVVSYGPDVPIVVDLPEHLMPKNGAALVRALKVRE